MEMLLEMNEKDEFMKKYSETQLNWENADYHSFQFYSQILVRNQQTIRYPTGNVVIWKILMCLINVKRVFKVGKCFFSSF